MRFLGIILLFFCSSAFAGGPWLVKKKGGFLQFQSTLPIGSYNRLFLENNNDANLNRTVLDFTFQGYLEYGITDKLNLIAVLPFKYISTGSETNLTTNTPLLPSGNLAGIGNIEFSLKRLVFDKNWKVAVSVQTSLNTVSTALSKGLVTGYQSNSIGFNAHVGKSFSANVYSFIEGGYHFSGNNFSDFIKIHYEVGYQLKPNFWTALTLDVRSSQKNGDFINPNLRQTGFYTNNQEFFAYGVKAAKEFNNKTGITLATFGAFSGNFVAHLATVSVGVYKKW